jgi:ADP-ribose pyrophosphatase
MEIIKEEIIYSNRFVIEQGTIKLKNDEFKRERINRVDAAVVFILNTESNKVVLTRQFRYAVSAKEKDRLLEIVAGKLDEDEEPLNAAIRESEEEAGYRIKKENIKLVNSFFVSPGYTSEKFNFYYATVTNADKTGKGGGLKNEHEYIEVVEMDVNEFERMVVKGEIRDGKTYTAGLYFILQQKK